MLLKNQGLRWGNGREKSHLILKIEPLNYCPHSIKEKREEAR